jgi:hypothetical protein
MKKKEKGKKNFLPPFHHQFIQLQVPSFSVFLKFSSSSWDFLSYLSFSSRSANKFEYRHIPKIINDHQQKGIEEKSKPEMDSAERNSFHTRVMNSPKSFKPS